ncbi:hypothetical protein G4B88_024904 [Cannabis sativa]|uniref:Uncharacterized protein n=1 Tax=Cannabis sativa TaxID=3483 RepID=A0A7J6G908_CANSA|nr:hypothetical protein G4B88_024904 [Cannabis sativa]
MRLFGWMQNKLNGKQTTKNTNTVPATNYAKQEPREEFSDWPQGLLSIGTFDNDYNKDEDIDKTISVILGKCREAISAGKNKKDNIGKKSISFLLKKMFVCGSGFGPTPSLRDSLQESKMEKLLRTMLHKKMAPQNPNRASSAKKYLGDKPITPKKRTNNDNDQDQDQHNEKRRERTDDGGKWVKTDSEYIVLEI